MASLLQRIFGPYPTLGRDEKVPPGRSLELDSILSRLNQLETTLQRLEMDNADRQVTVLTTVEKVMHQLRARDRKRERTEAEEDGDGAPVPGDASLSTAHLSARFRR